MDRQSVGGLGQPPNGNMQPSGNRFSSQNSNPEARRTSAITEVVKKSAPVYKLPSAADLAALSSPRRRQPARDQIIQSSYDISPNTAIQQPKAIPVQSKAAAQDIQTVPQPVQRREPDYEPIDDYSLENDFYGYDQPAESDSSNIYEERLHREEQRVRNGEQRPSLISRLQFSKAQYGFIALGVVVLIGGVTVSVLSLKTNKDVVAQVQADQVRGAAVSNNDENTAPSEDAVDANALSDHTAKADQPRRISIAKTKTNARVFAVGANNNNQIKGTSNIFDLGWYDQSALPGEDGVMLIDGYVHGPSKPGVLYGIKKLSQNDIIEVEKGDGTIVKYKIVKTQIYYAAATDMKAAMTPVVPNEPALNIVTRSSQNSGSESLYNERLIVFATLVR